MVECVGSKCAYCRRVDAKTRHDELASERAAGRMVGIAEERERILRWAESRIREDESWQIVEMIDELEAHREGK